MQVDAETIVGDVLDRYPATLDVFVAFGFTPLRNRLLRAAMAPLITVGGACRFKQVPPDRERDLIAALNRVAAAAPTAPTTATEEGSDDPLAERPPEKQGKAWYLDNRGLVPPEPMLRILHLLQQIAPDETVIAFNDREPLPLYDRLKALGYSHRAEPRSDGSWQITIDRGQGMGE